MESQEPKVENQYHFEKNVGEISLKENIAFEEQVDKGLRMKVSYSQEFSMSVRLEETSYLTWMFDWNELEKKGVDGFTGCITVSALQQRFKSPQQKYLFEVTHEVKSVTRRIGTVAELSKFYSHPKCGLKYEVTLQSFNLPNRCLEIDNQFNQSAFTDLTLRVDGYTLHWNSQMLKSHSKFFSNKLSAYVMDHNLPIIDLPGVRYEAFSRLLAMIHPEAILPSEEFFECILELAKNLSISAASRLITQMILRGSHLNFYEVLAIGDKFDLDEVVDTCISFFTSKEHFEGMKKKESLKHLSAGCSKKILGKYLEI